MKKPIISFIVLLAICCQSFAQSQNVIFESIYLNPKTENIKELGEKMKAHNQKYHAAIPYRAGVWSVLSGERAGDLLWIMGPFTFADLDNRPGEGGHDDDWTGNVLPLTNGMHHGYYWQLMPDFVYSPSENYRGKIMRVRSVDLKPGKMDEYQHMLTLVMKVMNANNFKNSFSVYRNRANDGERDVAVVWQFDNYAALDVDNEFDKKYEEVHGDNSWNQWQEAMRDIVVSTSDELLEFAPKMSAE